MKSLGNHLSLIFQISIFLLLIFSEVKTDSKEKEDQQSTSDDDKPQQSRLASKASSKEYTRFPEPPHCGQIKLPQSSNMRILGGQSVKNMMFPWMVFISVGCGGTMINERWVLTAAHCFDDTTQRDKVYVVLKALGRRRINVAKVIVHAQYVFNATVFYNDVAVLRLETPVKFDSRMRPICLPLGNQANYKNIINRNAIVSGWGKTELYNQSTVLMRASVRIWNADKCQQFTKLKKQILNSAYQICAGGLEGIDACTGDSGGPLFLRLRSNRKSIKKAFYQVGIVSFGLQCGAHGFPGIYTNLTTYIPWIRKQILAHDDDL